MSRPAPRPEIRVAAAVIRDAADRVLLSQRPDGKHMAGFWEFPGGKLEPGETLADGLARELREELGIAIEGSEPLIEIAHDYPDRRVRLLVHEVTRFAGRPDGREAQRIAWVAPDRMDAWNLLPADGPIVRALQLPPVCLVTPDPHTQANFGAFLEQLETACRARCDLILLRAPTLTVSDYRSLARRAAPVVERHAGRLLLHDSPELASEIGVAGVHLSSRCAAAFEQRSVPESMWLGVSCHDAEELAAANRLEADFAILGNVRETPSHRGRAGMGWQQFEAFVRPANLPVFAIGGVAPEDIPVARRAGGQGIAAIRSLWPQRAGN